MSMIPRQAKFLLDACKLIEFATAQGFTVTGGELFRTPEQEAIYVKTGKSQTTKSNHLIRCAIDLNFFKDGVLISSKAVLQPLGDFFEKLTVGNRWGGNWKSFQDLPHFESNQ